MVKLSRKKSATPGCKRVTLTLPNALLESMEGVIAAGNRSRFLSYCARARLARTAADHRAEQHWEDMIKGLLDE